MTGAWPSDGARRLAGARRSPATGARSGPSRCRIVRFDQALRLPKVPRSASVRADPEAAAAAPGAKPAAAPASDPRCDAGEPERAGCASSNRVATSPARAWRLAERRKGRSLSAIGANTGTRPISEPRWTSFSSRSTARAMRCAGTSRRTAAQEAVAEADERRRLDLGAQGGRVAGLREGAQGRRAAPLSSLTARRPGRLGAAGSAPGAVIQSTAVLSGRKLSSGVSARLSRNPLTSSATPDLFARDRERRGPGRSRARASCPR